MGFGAISLRHNSGLSVLSFSGMFFTDDANSIIGIFFLRTVLFLIAKSCSAVFGTKSLLFALQWRNEVTGKDLGCGVLCGAQILLDRASPAWLGLCSSFPAAFGVSVLAGVTALILLQSLLCWRLQLPLGSKISFCYMALHLCGPIKGFYLNLSLLLGPSKEKRL